MCGTITTARSPFGWALLTLVPLAIAFDASAALAAFVHAALAEYLSFIVLLFALYVTAGGILIKGNLGGTPAKNLAVLAFGTCIASFVGTTGAAMILIRPLIRANAARHCTHVVIFFIFLVANIGGALTPLGDPPLFVGFLHGVDFFWTAQHLWLQTAIVAVLVLAIFFAVDAFIYRREKPALLDAAPIRVRGRINLVADRHHRRRDPAVGGLATRHRLRRLRHHADAAQCAARRRAHSHRVGFALAHPGRTP